MRIYFLRHKISDYNFLDELGSKPTNLLCPQAVNDLCIHKMGGNLYQNIQSECEVHISTALQSLIGQSPDLVVFLSLVEKCWQDFSDQMLIIRSIALYLDRTYVKQSNGVDSLWEMGLKLFEKHLSNNKEVLHKIVTGLLRLIEQERYVEHFGLLNWNAEIGLLIW